jgi:hypothetical protein
MSANPNQDQANAYAMALAAVNAQIDRLQGVASSLVSTIGTDSAAVQAALNYVVATRDAIAALYNTADPDAQTRATAAMQNLAAGLPVNVDAVKAPLDPIGSVGDAITGKGSDLLGLLLVGALVYLLVEHEEGRGG